MAQIRELTLMQKKFCEELVQDPDRVQYAAAMRAGYSLKTAASQSVGLMKNPRIIAEIARLDKLQMKRIGVDPDRILQELAKIAFANPQDYASMTEDGGSIRDIPRNQAAAISEINIESTESDKVSTKKARLKMLDKRAALIDIGKHIGMFREKLEHTGTITLQQLVEESMKGEA